MKAKTKGINIMRKKHTITNERKEVIKKEYLRCRVNAAMPWDHKMLVFERDLINGM